MEMEMEMETLDTFLAQGQSYPAVFYAATVDNAVATAVKTVLRLVPMLVTATMITAAINATIRPYSTAVAPSSSFQKAFNPCMNELIINLLKHFY
jgi:hypothetical protein